MENNVLIREIYEQLFTALKNNNIKEIRSISKRYYPADCADALSKFNISDLLKIIRILETSESADIFIEFNEEIQENLVKSFQKVDIAKMFDELEIDEIREILDELPSNIVKKVLESSSRERRNGINQILNYPEGSVGSLMNTDYVEIKSGWTVMHCVNVLKKLKGVVEDVPDLFVIDSRRRLIGKIYTSTLIFNEPNTIVDSVMETNIHAVHTTDDKETLVDAASRYNEAVIPVVNRDQRLVGIVTYDDILDIVEEEATEDIQLMAGMKPATTSYFRSTVIEMFRSRIVWLSILMISATLSQIVIEQMNNWGNGIIGAAAVALVLSMLPIISGSAGNAGSQSSTMVIRALATDDIRKSDYYKVIFKEFRVALAVGLTMCVLNLARSLIYYSINGDLTREELYLSIGASVSIVVAIVLAKLVGSMLPMLAVKMKIDPAVMSAPILTTLVDALSILIFMGISIAILYALI